MSPGRSLTRRWTRYPSTSQSSTTRDRYCHEPRLAGVAGDEDGEMEGTNYFATTDVDADEYAGQAVGGIESVIDGEQDLFTMETRVTLRRRNSGRRRGSHRCAAVSP